MIWRVLKYTHIGMDKTQNTYAGNSLLWKAPIIHKSIDCHQWSQICLFWMLPVWTGYTETNFTNTLVRMMCLLCLIAMIQIWLTNLTYRGLEAVHISQETVLMITSERLDKLHLLQPTVFHQLHPLHPLRSCRAAFSYITYSMAEQNGTRYVTGRERRSLCDVWRHLLHLYP